MPSLAYSADATSASAQELADHLPQLRAELEQQRRFRSEQLAELNGSAGSITFPRTATDPRDEVAEVVRAGASIALAEIDAALSRMHEGRYGQCEQCHRLIRLARLEILPMAALCMPCQRVRESGRG